MMPNRQLRELGAKLTAAWTQPLFDEELVLLGELLQQFGPDSVPTAFELLQSKALANGDDVLAVESIRR